MSYNDKRRRKIIIDKIRYFFDSATIIALLALMISGVTFFHNREKDITTEEIQLKTRFMDQIGKFYENNINARIAYDNAPKSHKLLIDTTYETIRGHIVDDIEWLQAKIPHRISRSEYGSISNIFYDASKYEKSVTFLRIT